MISLRQGGSRDGVLHDLAPDLTPILDILFILLVFFMLTAGAVFQSLDLRLPSGVSEVLSPVDEPKRITLEIGTGVYALDGRRITDFDELKAAVSEAVRTQPGHELVIAGDRRVPLEELLRVLVYLRAQGIEAASILMRGETTE